MTEKLSIGIPYTLTKDQVYAMPFGHGVIKVHTLTPGVTAEASTDVDFTTFISLTLFTTYFAVALPFIRITSGDADVHLIPDL